MRIIISLSILSTIFLIAGCQTGSYQNRTLPTTTALPLASVPTQGESVMTPTLPAPTDPALQTLIQRVKEDLASRLAIPVNGISLTEFEEVEWSDSSLGCPQPGMDYLQVITPGYLILLEAYAQTYEYHSNRDTFFVLCENSSPPSLPKP